MGSVVSRSIAILAAFLIASCTFSNPKDLVGPDTPVDPAQSTIVVDRSTGIEADGENAITITVTLVDAIGRPLPGRTVEIQATGGSNMIVQPAPTNDDGVATATLASTKAEAKQLTAIADPAGSATTIAEPLTVQFIAGPLSKLTYLVTPDDEVAGAPITPAIQVGYADQYGNVVTTVTSTITLSIETNVGNGTLSGTATVAAVAGVATFSDIVINKAGVGYRLKAVGSGVPAAISELFTVGLGPPAKLAFLDLPDPAIAGAAITPALRVELQDAFGNRIPNATDPVTIAIGTNPASGTLSGTLTTAAVGGLATFSDLSINRKGIGYTLTASGGVAPGTSAAFEVSAAAPNAAMSTVVASPSTNVVADGVAASTITVTVKDAFGNGVPNQTVTIESTNGGDTISSPPVTDANGVTTALVRSTVAEVKTITAKLGGTQLGTQQTVGFVPGAPAQLLAVSGHNQSGTAGQVLAPFIVEVKDAQNNLVSGAVVSFTVTAGDGMLSTASATTGVDGRAQTTMTVQQTGTSIVAASTAMVAFPVVFKVVATTLSAAAEATTGTSPDGVAIGDINRDGRPDVVTANANASSISVLLSTTPAGATSASFAAKVDFSSIGTSPHSVDLGDLNLDGKLDVVVTTQSGYVTVLINTTAAGATTPTFAAGMTVTTQSISRNVEVADFDNDGRLDLAVSNAAAGTVSVLRNTTAPGSAAATFAAALNLPAGDATEAVTVADFNADGRPDIAAANRTAQNVSVSINTTAPGATTLTFTAATSFSLGTASPLAITTADFNGDRRPDLAVTHDGVATVSILLDTTIPGSTTPTFTTTEISGGAWAFVTAGDVNGDGRPDIVFGQNFSGGPSNVSTLLNTTGPGSSTPSFAPKITFAIAQATNVTVGDVNGDGRLDVMSTSSSSNTVAVRLNTTTPGHSLAFQARRDSSTPGARDVAVGDINRDGRLDIVASNDGAASFTVLVSTTAAGAVVPTGPTRFDFATLPFPQHVDLHDMNGDGVLDVILASGSAKISVLLNTTTVGAATPTFAASTDVAFASNVFELTIADFNLDGRPDLAGVLGQDDVLAVALSTTAPGATTATFALPETFVTGDIPLQVHAGDINLDGRMDLVVGNQNTNTVSVFVNTTAPGAVTASFAAKFDITLPALSAAGYLRLADLNGDGKLDVAVSIGPLSISINTTAPGASTPAFAAEQTFATGACHQIFAAADVDGDGLIDIAGANQCTDTISIRRNTTPPGVTTVSFAATVDVAAGLNPYDGAVSDLNGDGRLDFVIPNSGSNTVSTFYAQ